MRLGIVNRVGEQKGVDSKIVTDLSELARNRSICEAVLVGGDEDLRIGMELAQQYGVRVHLLTIEGSSFSTTLQQESDTHSTISRTDVTSFLAVTAPPLTAQATKAPAQPKPAIATPTTTSDAPTTAASVATTFTAVVGDYLETLPAAEQPALMSAIQAGRVILPEHDGRLLARARAAIQRDLENREKTLLRNEL
ncbi:MAG TPA: NYN domain-containing protein, partial [Terracidiphilus sp.]|nr:NYN domain-containing protein [Terracidiphilus sp.]